MGKIRTQDVMTAQRNTNMCRKGERLFIRERNETSISVMRVTYQAIEDVFVTRGKVFEVPSDTFTAEDEKRDREEMAMLDSEMEHEAAQNDMAAADVKGQKTENPQ